MRTEIVVSKDSVVGNYNDDTIIIIRRDCPEGLGKDGDMYATIHINTTLEVHDAQGLIAVCDDAIKQALGENG